MDLRTGLLLSFRVRFPGARQTLKGPSNSLAMDSPPEIFFSVGEPSGDLHAARLIRRLKSANPSLDFWGLGGPQMRDAGCSILYPLTQLAVVGFVEVLPRLRDFRRVVRIAEEHFDRRPPSAVVLVDFPGFNWHIARRAKERGIPVFYYLPPQMWAWGKWRIHKMRRTVDQVLCSLPFEYQWYRKQGVRCHFVGHPFFDHIHEQPLDSKFVSAWQQDESVQIAVLPGSRSRELFNIWPMQLASIRQLSQRHPSARFLVACLKDAHCVWCKRQLTDADRHLNIEFFAGKTSEILQIADCSMMKSGSVSLEIMARGVPSVVVYHVGRILYHVARRLTDVQTLSLPNMLAGRTVMQEFLAVGSTEKAIAQVTRAMDRLIGEPAERSRQRAELLALADEHALTGATDRTAEVILSTLGEHSRARSLAAA